MRNVPNKVLLCLTFCLVVAFCINRCKANLVHVGGSVYRTGSGTSSLYWYLDMHDLVNRTWTFQEWYAANLEVDIEGIENNWHVATRNELDQLLVFGGHPSPQNTLVAIAVGVDMGPPEYATHARYNDTWTAGGITQHYNTKLSNIGGGWSASPQGMYWDDDLAEACGAWIATSSPPYVRTEADGPYLIDVGETVLLDSTGSYSNCGIDELRWRINGQDVGASVSYDTLVSELGLGFGIHKVELRGVGGGVSDYDYTTIEIIPEPSTLLLLGLGGLFLRKRKR